MDENIGRVYAFKRGISLDNTMFYMGSLMGFLVSGHEVGGGVCLMEYRSRPGNEPPPHIHDDHDEILYLLEGSLQAFCGDDVFDVTVGESLFLPRARAHAWYVTSPTLRALILTQPAGLDDYFRAMATPADRLDLPQTGVTYAMDDPGHAIRVGREHGIRILTPEQTRDALPRFPGFPKPSEASR